MRFGITLFTSDRGITPCAAAQAAESTGFDAFYVPEHPHIPVRRDAAHPQTGDETLPDDRYMRNGEPEVLVLARKPDPDKLARWRDLGVTEVVFGMPDADEEKARGYLERLSTALEPLRAAPSPASSRA